MCRWLGRCNAPRRKTPAHETLYGGVGNASVDRGVGCRRWRASRGRPLMASHLYRRNFTVALAFIALLPSLVGLYFLDQERRDSDRRARQALASLVERQALSSREDAWARYDDSIGACLRGRDLREQQNSNNEIIGGIVFLFASVLNDAALDQVDKGDPKRASELRLARDQIVSRAMNLKPLPQPVCKDVINQPVLPRPGT